MDPSTYIYYSPVLQRNHEAPVSYKGNYSTDLIAQKALEFLDDAAQSPRPFFLGISPIAPHAEFIYTGGVDQTGFPDMIGSPPWPAKRHENLFNDVIVPRTPNFNPDKVSICREPIY
jgi:N-acetylglucosamine-6-sulfatase